MKGIKRVLLRPGVQTGLFLIFLIFLYWLLTRPSEMVQDIEVSSGRAYLAAQSAGVRVIDLDDPALPGELGAYDTAGITYDVDVQGSLLYAADGKRGLRIIDLSDLAKLKLAGQLDLPSTARGVDVEGRFAYVAADRAGLLLVNIENPNRPLLVSRLRTPAAARGVQVSGDKAFIYGADRLWIADISTPRQPEIIATYNADSDLEDLQVAGNLVFLAADRRGMVILDVSDLQNLREVAVVDTPDKALGVAVNGFFAYIADRRGGLRVVDITDPARPVRLGTYEQAGDALAVAADNHHVYVSDGLEGVRVLTNGLTLDLQKLSQRAGQTVVDDIDISGRFAYLAGGERGIRLLDLENPTQPREVGFVDTDGEARAVEAGQDIIYVADGQAGVSIFAAAHPTENQSILAQLSQLDTSGPVNDLVVQEAQLYLAAGPEGLLVVNVHDPNNPQINGRVDLAGDAMGLAVSDSHAYVAAGEAGLRVINVGDPYLPAEVALWDTPGSAQAVHLIHLDGNPRRSVVLIADGLGGLQIVDVTQTRSPQLVSSLPINDFVFDVALQGSFAYLAGQNGIFHVVDLSNLTQPKLTATLKMPGEGRGVFVNGPYAYVAAGLFGLRVVDIANPATPREAGFFDTPSYVIDADISGNQAYLLDRERGLWIADLADPTQIREIGFFLMRSRSNGLSVAGDFAFIAQDGGVQIVNVSMMPTPQEAAFLPLAQPAYAVAAAGQFAFVAGGEAGLLVLDFSDLKNFHQVAQFDTVGIARDVFLQGSYAYVADGDGGLQIINIADPRAPENAGWVPEARDARSVGLVGPVAYVAVGPNGIILVDVSLPANPRVISALEIGREASGISVAGSYVFVANGLQGITAYSAFDPAQPIEIGRFDTPGTAARVAVAPAPLQEEARQAFLLVVPDTEQGMQVISATKQARPKPRGIYYTPGRLPLLSTLRYVLPQLDEFALMRWSEVHLKAWSSAYTMFMDMLLFLVFYILTLSFAAQFILPIQDRLGRRASIDRLHRHIWGSHGLAVIVRDGKVIARKGETRRRGAGVIVVDAHSAAVVETSSLPVPMVFRGLARLSNSTPLPGPQRQVVRGKILFTKYQDSPLWQMAADRVRGVLDLRTQSSFQKDVRALTKNGIEIETSVSIIFTFNQSVDFLPVTYVLPDDPAEKSTTVEPASDEAEGAEEAANPAEAKNPATAENPEEISAQAENTGGGDGSGGPADTAQSNNLGEEPPQGNDQASVDQPWNPALYEADNLRVIRTTWQPGSGAENSGLFVTGLSDELDPQDKEEIHFYIQKALNGQQPPEFLPEPVGPPDLGSYHVDADRIYAGVTSQPIQFSEAEFENWIDFPSQVAAETFRDMLSQKLLDELYYAEDPAEYPLSQSFRPAFALKMRNLGVLGFEYVQNKDGSPIKVGQPWQENQLVFFPKQVLKNSKPLRDRGIKVIYSGFGGLMPVNERVFNERLDHWRSAWQKEAQIIRGQARRDALLIQSNLQVGGQLEMVQDLYALIGNSEFSDEAISLGVLGVLERAAENPETRKLLSQESLSMLWNIRRWLT